MSHSKQIKNAQLTSGKDSSSPSSPKKDAAAQGPLNAKATKQHKQKAFKQNQNGDFSEMILQGYRKPNFFKYNDCKDLLLNRLRTGRHSTKDIAEEAEIASNSTFYKYQSLLSKDSDLLLLTREEYEYMKKNKPIEEIQKINQRLRDQNKGWNEPPIKVKPVPVAQSETSSQNTTTTTRGNSPQGAALSAQPSEVQP
jgi:hypothetical protein